MTRKGNKVVMIPGHSADQLANQVAKALRDANKSDTGAGIKGAGVKKRASSDNSTNNSKRETPSWEGERFTQKDVSSDQSFSEQSLSERTSTSKKASQISLASDSPLSFIHPQDVAPNQFQTRVYFAEKELEELADSIKKKGLLQPIVVRHSSEENRYELIAGERRLRAAERAGLTEVPAIVQHLSDREALECSIIENAQREDLNSIEEARAFKLLISDFGLNQSDIAAAVGKNRTTISNSLRLLQLDDSVIEILESGELSAGHGRALCGLDTSEQLRFAKRALKQNLSVRALEALVQKQGAEEEVEIDENQEKINSALGRLESKIEDLIGIEKVSLSMDDDGRKKLSMRFDTDASFKRFIAKLKK